MGLQPTHRNENWRFSTESEGDKLLRFFKLRIINSLRKIIDLVSC
jgi:hypothetical protein